jgi:hypothetical protein
MMQSINKRIYIPSQERPSYPPIPWGRPCVPYNIHQWIVGNQTRTEHATPPPAESMRDGDASCCNLYTESCGTEAARLRGFSDGDA